MSTHRLDDLARVLHSKPGFLRAQLRKADQRIRDLEEQLAERDRIIEGLLAARVCGTPEA